MVPPPLTHAPAERWALAGVAAVRGAALPVYDLGVLMGGAPGRPERLVVLDAFGGIGLLVEAAEIAVPEASDAELDLTALTPPARAPRPARPSPSTGPVARADADREQAFVVVEAANRLYALPASSVRGVSRASAPLTAPALADLLHPHAAAAGEPRCVFEIQGDGGVARPIAAAGGELVRVGASLIDPAPALLRGRGVDRTLRLDGGRRLAAVLDVDTLLDELPPASSRAVPAAVPESPAETWVGFRIGPRSYVAEPEMVEATLRKPRLTWAPRAAGGVLGAVGWRGRILAVLGWQTGAPWLLILRLDDGPVAVALARQPELVRRASDAEVLDRATAADRLRQACAEAGA